MIAAARAGWLRVRLKRACNVIRKEAGRCGIDLSRVTDEELGERLELEELAANMGLKVTTLEQAAEAFRQLNRGFAALGAAQRARGEITDNLGRAGAEPEDLRRFTPSEREMAESAPLARNTCRRLHEMASEAAARRRLQLFVFGESPCGEYVDVADIEGDVAQHVTRDEAARMIAERDAELEEPTP